MLCKLWVSYHEYSAYSPNSDRHGGTRSYHVAMCDVRVAMSDPHVAMCDLHVAMNDPHHTMTKNHDTVGDCQDHDAPTPLAASLFACLHLAPVEAHLRDDDVTRCSMDAHLCRRRAVRIDFHMDGRYAAVC